MKAWSVIAVIAVLAPSTARADRLAIKVVEVAGGVAYLDHGRAAGVVRGTRVRFGRATLTVVETTEKTASVNLGSVRLAVAATGIADVELDAVSKIKTLPTPRTPEEFVGKWPDPEVPAASQAPAHVPLGGAAAATGRAQLAVIGSAFAAADRSGAAFQGEVRAIGSYELMTDRPLAADIDLSARAFSAGFDRGARMPVFLRTAQVRYGDAHDPRFALGRLRYAASSVGMLDGARAAVRIRALELAAFGGLVPDPLGGRPETGAARFGAEVSYDDPDAPWQPRVSVAGYGSTWDGELDERRLTVVASASKGAVFTNGWAEAQAFPSTNPWGAPAIELTGAGATAQYRRRGTRIGADVTFLRPERSLRLAAALPAQWLCTGYPQAGDVPDETCTGGDSWASTSVFAGARGARWSVDATGAVGRTNSITTSYDSSGYLAGELRIGPQRVLAGVSGGQASFASWMAAHLGTAFMVSSKVDVAARYRPERLDYRAATGAYIQHGGVVDVHVAISATLDIMVSALATFGPDRNAGALLTTVAWRPIR